jgi:hypothetical protein
VKERRRNFKMTINWWNKIKGELKGLGLHSNKLLLIAVKQLLHLSNMPPKPETEARGALRACPGDSNSYFLKRATESWHQFLQHAKKGIGHNKAAEEQQLQEWCRWVFGQQQTSKMAHS